MKNPLNFSAELGLPYQRAITSSNETPKDCTNNLADCSHNHGSFAVVVL